MKRLNLELASLSKNPPYGIVQIGPKDDSDFLTWSFILKGPEETPYHGHDLHGKITFSDDYPLSPPKVTFTHDLFHPNVYPFDSKDKSGEVCISILHTGDDETEYEHYTERWTPVQNVETILLSILSMVSEPNHESPANIDAAKMFREERENWKAMVGAILE